MRFTRLLSLSCFGTVVGLGGCMSGSVDDEAPSGGSSGSSTANAGGSVANSNSGGSGTSTHAGSTGSPGPTAGSTSSAAGGTTANGASGGANSGNGGTSTNGNGGTPGSSGGASAGSSSDSGSAGTGGSAPVTPKDCKRGIGWHGTKLDNAAVSSKLTWWYTWGMGAQTVGAGLEYVPMVWGGGSTVANVNNAIRPDAKFLLGFNEPNFFEQADMSAQEAAAGWPVLQAVAEQHQLGLVSPAVNYCGNDQAGTGPCHDTNPVDYLTDFFAACANCKVDYVAVHWYNCDGASLKSYLDLFAKFGRPIWLTEFACAYGGDTSVAGQEKYMREAIPILEARSDVYRYSWFSGDPIPNARLLNADGSPTPLGNVYLDLPHDPTCTP